MTRPDWGIALWRRAGGDGGEGGRRHADDEDYLGEATTRKEGLMSTAAAEGIMHVLNIPYRLLEHREETKIAYYYPSCLYVCTCQPALHCYAIFPTTATRCFRPPINRATASKVMHTPRELTFRAPLSTPIVTSRAVS